MSGGHGHHGHHGHHAMPTTTSDTSLPDITTTASTLLQSLLTTVVPAMHHEVSGPAKHVHHQHDMSSTMHPHITSDGDVHSAHGSHGTSGGHMLMYFHSSVDATILFKEWQVATVSGLIGSMIGIFLIAMMYEGLKFFREYLFKQYFSSIQYSTVSVTGQDGKTVTEIHKIARNRMVSWPHAFQTLLHIVQMVVSYMLMLIFMTYNVWLCIAVTLGAGAGYFLFGWRKATVVDVTEHCH